MSVNQEQLDIAVPKTGADTVEKIEFEPIKGYPMLHWRGKRPFRSTFFYPAQLKEVHGEEVDGWRNKIFWGDNLQVMGHLLKQFRGKVDLVYIDPPFDSKAEYKKKIQLHGQTLESEGSAFEEKQYTDIWTNDEYLQFIYERIVLIRELLNENGSVFIHCDFHKNYLIRCLLDEVFGKENLVNEIVWRRKGGTALGGMNHLSVATDTIYWYSKSPDYIINTIYAPASQEYIDQQFRYKDPDGRRYMITVLRSPSPRRNLMYNYKGYKMPPNGWAIPIETMKLWDEQGRLHFPDSQEKQIYKKIYLDEYKGQQINNLWSDISTLKGSNAEILNYPTQKPEELLERVVQLTTNPGDLVFDCFMGSGTTQAVAMKLGRCFLGADINLGAVQTTTKRLMNVIEEIKVKEKAKAKQTASLPLDEEGATSSLAYFPGFEVYNVNHYEVFRNPVEARDLLLDALEIQKLPDGSLFDGEKDGRMVKIMPINRIATRADLTPLLTGMDYKAFERRQAEHPNRAVEKVTLVCMGHEPDLAATLKAEVKPYEIDVEVVDILRDRGDLQFKRDSEAKVSIKDGTLTVEAFYPMNLLAKLSLEKEKVDDWREMADSIMIDWNYDGAIFTPTLVDIPEKNALVTGSYKVPEDAGTMRVKITDVLSESLEVEVRG